MGNLQVNKEKDGEIVGKFRLETHAEHGEKGMQWFTVSDQLIANTWFHEHPKHIRDIEKPRRRNKTN